MTPQQKFLNDVNDFITKHPYYTSNEGTLEFLNDDDQLLTDIHDPNGDYEQVQILINLIA